MCNPLIYQPDICMLRNGSKKILKVSVSVMKLLCFVESRKLFYSNEKHDNVSHLKIQSTFTQTYKRKLNHRFPGCGSIDSDGFGSGLSFVACALELRYKQFVTRQSQSAAVSVEIMLVQHKYKSLQESNKQNIHSDVDIRSQPDVLVIFCPSITLPPILHWINLALRCHQMLVQ